MAGQRVEALASELRGSGQHDLACRVVHAAERDIHDNAHTTPHDDCVYCHAEGGTSEEDREDAAGSCSSDPAYAGSYAFASASDGYIE